MNGGIKIVVPVDFSDLAENGLKTALKLSEKIDAEIHLLHIIQEPYIAAMRTDADMISYEQELAEQEFYLKESINKRTAEVQEMASRYQAESSKIIPVIKVGNFDENIARYVQNNSIDLVVMGTSGESTIAELFTGNHVERAVHDTNIPVLSIKNFDPAMQFKKMLLAIDVQDYHERAVNLLHRFTERLQMELLIVHVKLNKDVIEENIGEFLENFADKYGFKNYSLHVVSNGNVAGELDKLCDRYRVDLIASLSEEGIGIVRLFTGKVTRQLLKKAHHPLLTVRNE